MNLARSPLTKLELVTRSTSSLSSASVTFLRCGRPAILSSASRPIKSWSNLTKGP